MITGRKRLKRWWQVTSQLDPAGGSEIVDPQHGLSPRVRAGPSGSSPGPHQTASDAIGEQHPAYMRSAPPIRGHREPAVLGECHCGCAIREVEVVYDNFESRSDFLFGAVSG